MILRSIQGLAGMFVAGVLLLPSALRAEEEAAAAPPTPAAPADEAPAPAADAAAPAAEAAAPEAVDDDDVPEGHSFHGEAFNEGPRQAAYLMGGTGNVHLAITSSADDAQAFFDQGVGQMHGFWYFEAERSFRQVAKLDPECAMAYWGMAMANTNNETRAKGFIDEALERIEQASPREQQWIRALHAFYHGGGDSAKDKERRRQYVRALEQIIEDHPEEIEAKAFLAVLIWQNRTHGWPLNGHAAVDSLISDVLRENPMHPVHHYRIHLWDDEQARRALGSAALCGQSAPGIAHMWHMPGHIFSRLQRYNDAAWQQEASSRVDHAHMMRDYVLPDRIHNYAHNQEWLIRDLNHVGRVHDAIALACNLTELPRHPKYNTPARSGSARYGRQRLFETLVRYEMWHEIVALADTPYLEATSQTTEQIRRLRHLGAALYRTGDAARGDEVATELDLLLATEREAQRAAGERAEEEARAADKPGAEVTKARTTAENKHRATIQAIEAALAEVRGQAAVARGEYAAAIELLKKAASFPKEQLSQVYLLADNRNEAERLAREAVRSGRQQVAPLANLVAVLSACGKTGDAKKEFLALKKLAAEADLDVPVFRRLAALADEWGYPADWRDPLPSRADIGKRPPLDSLGPMVWSPPPAPSFTLVAADGREVSLSEYRGKPVVVICYLGFGCLHCVEQLKAFTPLVEQYREAGIELVGIGTDTSEALVQACESFDESGTFPFTLCSDPTASVFRTYRAYDDFEDQPLHGTFLIDGEGRLRWLDVSYEPFDDAAFLLEEARRLLQVEVGSR